MSDTRAGSRLATQTCLRCRTGIYSPTPRALLGAELEHETAVALTNSLQAIRSNRARADLVLAAGTERTATVLLNALADPWGPETTMSVRRLGVTSSGTGGRGCVVVRAGAP